jgi:23S rRNA (uracil1939-C5)-methyltransferase
MRERPDAAEVEGVVEAIVPGGAGIVRDRDGVVFASGGLPGERVRVLIERVQKRVRHGRVLAVLQPSADRIASDCAWHPKCGGCDLLELERNAALRVRESIVRDALVRVGKIDRDVLDRVVQPIRAGGDGLRRRVRVTVGEDGAATFSESASHERVAIAHCAAVVPALDGALALLPSARLAPGVGVRLAVDERGRVSAAVDREHRGACARLVEAGVAHGAVAIDVVDESEEARAGEPQLLGEVTAGAFACVSDASVFTQATRFGGGAIRDEVVSAAGDIDGEVILELFAGSGHLTIPLTKAGAYVDAIEGSRRAIGFLEENVDQFAYHLADAQHGFIDGHTRFRCTSYEVVVADPPRTGIVDFGAILERTSPKRLVLVSCDVATGARDISIAMSRGFHLAKLVPIDAFPRTSHVEWVATLLK